MKRRRAIVAAILTLSLAALLACIVLLRPRHELFYRGKTVREWAMTGSSGMARPSEVKSADQALRSLGPAAVPDLVRMLNARDSYLRAGLWSFAPRLPRFLQRAISRLVPPPKAARVRLAAARSLEALGPASASALPALTKALRTSDVQFRYAVAQALGSIGPPGRPILFATVRTPDINLRYAVLSALGHHPSPSADDPSALAAALDDPVDGIRLTAVNGLRNLGTNLAPYLRACIADETNAASRLRAAKVLGCAPLARSESVPMLATLARDPDPACRLEAVQILGRMWRPNVPMLIALTNALSDPDLRVKAAAVKGVENAALFSLRTNPIPNTNKFKTLETKSAERQR